MRFCHKIVFASTNRHKYQEIQALMQTYPEVEILPITKIIRNAHNLQLAETHDTYLENASAKARMAAQACHYPILADDSGLEIRALENRPGVHSHRYAPILPHMTQDQSNIHKVLKELEGEKNRSATFICQLVLLIEGVLMDSTGSLEGEITLQPHPLYHFGYDPIFKPKNHSKTLAELTVHEKNTLSHRFYALSALMQKVKTYNLTFAKP